MTVLVRSIVAYRWPCDITCRVNLVHMYAPVVELLCLSSLDSPDVVFSLVSCIATELASGVSYAGQ